MKEGVKMIYRRLQAKWFSLKMLRTDWYIISPYGIGDTYLLLSLMRKFKEQNLIKGKVHFFVTKKSHFDLINYFPQAVDSFQMIKSSIVQYVSDKDYRFDKRKAQVFHPFHFPNQAIQNLLSYKNVNLNDVYKLLLNVSLDTKNQEAFVSDSMREEASLLFGNYGLIQSKTILVAPHAISVDDSLVSFSDWDNFITNCIQDGYAVAILSSEKAYLKNPNVVLVDFPLSYAIAFGELCGFFVSLRSGFCDLIATSNCKKFILYPENTNAKSLFAWASLSGMEITKGFLKEYKVYPGEANQIFSQIKIELS